MFLAYLYSDIFEERQIEELALLVGIVRIHALVEAEGRETLELGDTQFVLVSKPHYITSDEFLVEQVDVVGGQ
jgi:uncharacterized membrane protein